MAAEVLEQFPDGVWFVDLSVLTDPALVPGAIAEVLGVRETGGTPLVELLQGYLRERHLLLVLDNLEQLLPDAAPVIGDLVGAAPGVTVLVTSRVPLRLRAEQEVAVPPLGLPRRTPPPTLEQLTQYEAVRLFITRARAVKADFAATNASAPAIAEICHRLDGLPLAIELAAARVRLFPPEAMLRRLATRLTMLTGGARDLPVRQQTLRGAIAWSYELLTPDEQALFRRLSVFAGGFTLEAAEAVAAGDELGLDLVDGLERLVEHSLARQTEAEGEPRFTMLETIREYGLEQLTTQGETEEAHTRHVHYFLDLAKVVAAERKGPEAALWINRLESEQDNARVALTWALERDPHHALSLVASLSGFWAMRGYIAEARGWLNQILASPAPKTMLHEWAECLNWMGMFASAQIDVEGTEQWGRQALKLSRTLGYQLEIAFALITLSYAADLRGEQDQAITLLEEAVGVARELGDADTLGETINQLGYMHYLYGNLEHARPLLQEAVAILTTGGPSFSLPNTLHSLGEVLRALGDITGARESYRESISLVRSIGARVLLLQNLEGLAMVDAAQGNTVRATRLLGATETWRKEMGLPYEPSLQADYDITAGAIQETLGESEFARAWEAGKELSVEEAIAEALVDGPQDV